MTIRDFFEASNKASDKIKNSFLDSEVTTVFYLFAFFVVVIIISIFIEASKDKDCDY